MFSEVRALATMEERRRLAREIHDGIAQEIASLGYVVDELVAEERNDEQRERISALRDELTRIVSELRFSILTYAATSNHTLALEPRYRVMSDKSARRQD